MGSDWLRAAAGAGVRFTRLSDLIDEPTIAREEVFRLVSAKTPQLSAFFDCSQVGAHPGERRKSSGTKSAANRLPVAESLAVEARMDSTAGLQTQSSAFAEL